MRKVLLLGAIFLGLTGVAQAQVVPSPWVNAAESAAQSYWGNAYPLTRPCAAPPALIQEPLGATEGGDADYNDCAIDMDSDNAWTPYAFCVSYLHEWGHLTLGPMYFQASNPADPAHSLDPTSIMQASQAIYALDIPQCQTMPAVDPPEPGTGTAMSSSEQRPHRYHLRSRAGLSLDRALLMGRVENEKRPGHR